VQGVIKIDLPKESAFLILAILMIIIIENVKILAMAFLILFVLGILILAVGDISA